MTSQSNAEGLQVDLPCAAVKVLERAFKELYTASMLLDEHRRAVHEAGHVTVALSYGWRVNHVDIVGGSHGQGMAEAPPPQTEIELLDVVPSNRKWHPIKRDYEQLIIQLAGGAAAEEWILGFSMGEGSPQAGTSDWGLCIYLFEEWKKGGQRPPLRFGEQRPFGKAKDAAKKILKAPAHRLFSSDLTEALLEKRCLPHDEIMAIWMKNQTVQDDVARKP